MIFVTYLIITVSSSQCSPHGGGGGGGRKLIAFKKEFGHLGSIPQNYTGNPSLGMRLA
jgi:hypothetical protein